MSALTTLLAVVIAFAVVGNYATKTMVSAGLNIQTASPIGMLVAGVITIAYLAAKQ
ncbi:hypothetical protein [Halorussus salinus]|uniref:hypothetical protein n=1 Tax=Halorussus salinus TaxID=1364935 RepID=UPI00138F9638|nr:hypothetical protein [Halorussus salinus]